MNKRGFVTPFIALAIMLTSLAFLAVFYANVASNNIRIKTHEPNIESFIERRTAQERVYGVFLSDFTKEGTILFPDSNIRIEIEEHSETNLKRVLTLTPVWQEDETATKLSAYKVAVARPNGKLGHPVTVTILETGIQK